MVVAKNRLDDKISESMNVNCFPRVCHESRHCLADTVILFAALVHPLISLLLHKISQLEMNPSHTSSTPRCVQAGRSQGKNRVSPYLLDCHVCTKRCVTFPVIHCIEYYEGRKNKASICIPCIVYSIHTCQAIT